MTGLHTAGDELRKRNPSLIVRALYPGGRRRSWLFFGVTLGRDGRECATNARVDAFIKAMRLRRSGRPVWIEAAGDPATRAAQ